MTAAYTGPDRRTVLAADAAGAHSQRKAAEERAALAEQQRDEAMAKVARFDWLAANYLGADFDWNGGNQVLVITIPSGTAVCADLGMTVDAALAKTAGASAQPMTLAEADEEDASYNYADGEGRGD